MSILLLISSGLWAAPADISGQMPRYFQFEQATLLIRDCHKFSIQTESISDADCLVIFEQLADWTRDRYVGPEEAAQAIRDATQVRELYVPVFAIISNSESLDAKQQAEAAAAFKLALDKMAGFRGGLKFENPEQGNLFVRFIVDAMVALAVGGAQTARIIGQLNDLAVGNEQIRVAYDIAIKKRVRFLIDFASHDKLKNLELWQKTHFFSTTLFRPFQEDIQLRQRPYHNNSTAQLFARFEWKTEAEKIVIDKPLQTVLEGLLQNRGVDVTDTFEMSSEDGVVVTKSLQRLHDIGGWAGLVLERLGFTIEQTPRGGRRRKREQDYMPFSCEESLVPIPVRER